MQVIPQSIQRLLSRSELVVRPLPLRINFAWTLTGNVIYAFSQWGMMVALAKFGSPEMVGRFALGLAVTAPIMLFASLALRPVQATDVQKAYRFGDYLVLRLITTVIALLVITGIVWAGNYGGETRWVILLIGLAKAFESVSDIYYGLFQQTERMDRVAASMILKGPLSLLALTVAVYVTRRVWAAAGALAVAWAAVLALYDIPNGIAMLRRLSGSHEPGISCHWPSILNLARLSFPLGLTMMLISLNTNIPRYFVERFRGERELGFFAAVAYLITAGSMVVNALGQSASPRLAKYYASENREGFSYLLFRLIGIGLALGVTGILISLFAGREILTLLYRKEYAEFNNVLIWVMAAATLGYMASFLGYAMTAAHYFAIQPVIFGAVALANSLFCMALVPRHGALGAAWALGLANLVQFLASLVCVIVALYRLPHRKSSSEVVLYELER